MAHIVPLLWRVSPLVFFRSTQWVDPPNTNALKHFSKTVLKYSDTYSLQHHNDCNACAANEKFTTRKNSGRINIPIGTKVVEGGGGRGSVGIQLDRTKYFSDVFDVCSFSRYLVTVFIDDGQWILCAQRRLLNSQFWVDAV